MDFEPAAVNVICSDLERSVRFYRDVLGFRAGERGERFAHLHAGDRTFTLLAFAQPRPEPWTYCTQPEISVDLICDDVDAAVARFRANDIVFVGPYEPGSGRVFIRDPDGLVLEVVQRGAF